MIGFSISNKEKVKENTDRTVPTVIEEKAVRSVVTVHFINGREYPYYNDMFNLKVGDVVYVDGKLAGIPGRVTEVTTKFKVSLDFYKRVIAKLNLEFHGEFKKNSCFMLCDNPDVLTIEQVRKWYFPPREEEEEFFVGDRYEIKLDNIMNCEDIDEFEFADAVDIVKDGEVKFITINNGKGFAIVKRNKPHLVEFEYSNGVIKNLLCDCIKPNLCDHSIAACIAVDILTEKNIDRDEPEFTAIDINEFLKIVSYTNKDISVKI
ncbi:MAG: hypothetical protein NC397_10120 [Clostridium sp.]|nr:hypothetical protein [Clostridium sp.]